jgi:hypothetical protein
METRDVLARDVTERRDVDAKDVTERRDAESRDVTEIRDKAARDVTERRDVEASDWFLRTISVLIARAIITFLFLSATIAFGVDAVLVITTGTWIASATVPVALPRCALRLFTTAEPAPSPELGDKV